MPVIETTLIEGYDADTKARLMKGMARVVLSVMAASPDGITTVIREVAPSSYARGGVSRVPGPPLPPGAFPQGLPGLPGGLPRNLSGLPGLPGLPKSKKR